MLNQNQVLMLGWEYPPHNSGGLGVACDGLTRALSDQEVEIHFTLPYHHPGDLTHMHVLECFSRITTHQLSPLSPPFSSYVRVNSQGKPLNFDPRNIRALTFDELEFRVNEYAQSIIEVLDEQRIESQIVHAHDWMTYPAAEVISQQTGNPFVAHVHSTEFDRVPDGNGNGLITHIESEGLQTADRVIAVSEFTKQVLIDKYGIDENKIDVVHNGIDQAPAVQSLRFAPGRPVIVFMGRLAMQKGADYFLQLANKVLQKIPDALFVVAGSGDQYSLLLLEAAGQQLSSSVVFAGFLRDQQKDFLLDRADVFVMPSIAEPFGLVALEAVQRETPVIVSKTSGVREVLPGAIAVDFWDTNLMAEHIEHLLKDPNYHHQVVNEQLKNISGVTWANAAEKVRDVYSKILQKSKA